MNDDKLIRKVIRTYSKLPARNAMCEMCGNRRLAPIPTFAIGCGLSARTIADDVMCLRCGYMGQPAYEELDTVSTMEGEG